MKMGASRTGGYFPFNNKYEWMESEIARLKKELKEKDKEIARILRHELEALGLVGLMSRVKAFESDIAVIIEKQIEGKCL